ncbi:hypothetical protein N836_31750 [Leptolyngbya sp. Heron Island J]|uniref:hypothetical protein n=1 Tax=Leptolyngbya sp. Heron Island J TaxID=1385935 RepID=UPI0003B98767|nr:hypothetical protein [Leptolyngbya sp. Heron Island J]ESA38516.1 hypothetical protein N836_31750 [Leptolyngbya sp. Heron Island J]
MNLPVDLSPQLGMVSFFQKLDSTGFDQSLRLWCQQQNFRIEDDWTTNVIVSQLSDELVIKLGALPRKRLFNKVQERREL